MISYQIWKVLNDVNELTRHFLIHDIHDNVRLDAEPPVSMVSVLVIRLGGSAPANVLLHEP